MAARGAIVYLPQDVFPRSPDRLADVGVLLFGYEVGSAVVDLEGNDEPRRAAAPVDADPGERLLLSIQAARDLLEIALDGIDLGLGYVGSRR